MLFQIRDYIAREGVVSDQQIARAFHMDKYALEPLLERWMRKGVIQRCHEASFCKTKCFQCHETKPVFYQIRN